MPGELVLPGITRVERSENSEDPATKIGYIRGVK